jgi:hypothetical protein
MTTPRKDRKKIIAELKQFGRDRSLKKGTTIRDLIEEGRRFSQGDRNPSSSIPNSNPPPNPQG